MVTVFFESHGTTFDNEAGISSGLSDADLSPLGERQARELGERHKDEHFDAIFCSDLKRSYRTADLAFHNSLSPRERDGVRGKLHDRPPIIRDARLNECDYGDLTGADEKTVNAHKVGYVKQPFPHGESYAQTAARMKRFLQDLLKNYDDKKVLIIGHRATQYGLEHWLNGVPLKDAVTAPWSWQPGWTYHLEKLAQITPLSITGEGQG